MTRVVVTGLGAVTPVGNTANDFWMGFLTAKLELHQLQSLTPLRRVSQLLVK